MQDHPADSKVQPPVHPLDARPAVTHPGVSPAGVTRPVVTVAGRSDVGRVRILVMDAYLVAALSEAGEVRKGATETIVFADTPTFLVVADGVGGAASGDIASLMATDTMLIDLRRQQERGLLTSVPEVDRAMRAAISTANRVIHTYATSNPRHQGMATTATLAVVFQGTLLLAQVGDSRAYLIRDGHARQITKDQSLVQRLVDAGELTEIEAEQSERRNIILQALGFEDVVVPDLYQEGLRLHDVLVLCSDGLSNHVPPEDLTRIVLDAPDIGMACHQLVELANERGGYDNITVVIAVVEERSPYDTDDADRTTLDAKRQGFAARVRQWLR